MPENIPLVDILKELGQGDNDDPWQRKYHLDVMCRQPWPEKPLGTEDQQKDQTHDYRRYGERQIDQGSHR